MDVVIEKARAAAAYIAGAFKAVATIVLMTRVPPCRIEATAEQMAINYKAIGISIILVFLARGLEGTNPDVLGSLLVVVMFVLIALALLGAATVLMRLAIRLKSTGVAPPADARSKWLTLLTAMWTWGLAVVVLHGIAHNWLHVPHFNLFFDNEFVVPVLAAILGLLAVIVVSKILGRYGPKWDRVFALHWVLSVPFIAVALWAAVFWKF